MWSALASQADECNTLQKSSAATFFQILTHMCWTFLCLFSLSIASAQGDGESNAVAQQFAEDEEGEADPDKLEVEVGGETKKGSELFVFPVTLQTLAF